MPKIKIAPTIDAIIERRIETMAKKSMKEVKAYFNKIEKQGDNATYLDVCVCAGLLALSEIKKYDKEKRNRVPKR